MFTCPCTDGGTSPNFVGYYCESALSGPPWDPPVLFSNDTLWDGQDCNIFERTCCSKLSTTQGARPAVEFDITLGVELE